MNLQLPLTPRLATGIVFPPLSDQDDTLFSKSYFEKCTGSLRSCAAGDLGGNAKSKLGS